MEHLGMAQFVNNARVTFIRQQIVQTRLLKMTLCLKKCFVSCSRRDSSVSTPAMQILVM